MTQQEIQGRNEQIALMLGYVNTTPTDKDFNIFKSRTKIGSIPNMIETMSMKFHSDWNWLMEAVEFAKGCYRNYDTYPTTMFGGLLLLTISNSKETVFIAVSDFAKLYNDKKL
jgi:hypothetical protein